MSEKKRVRIRTASSQAKALQNYEELLAEGTVERAVVIVEQQHGITMLGQGLRPYILGKLMLYAANAFRELMDRDCIPVAEPLTKDLGLGGSLAGPALSTKVIQTGPDGKLIPPADEQFISCGECRHTRWYVLLTQDTLAPVRFSCAHCGNEVVMREVSGHGVG